MNPEQIVTSLELSKKLEPYLKDYESLFWWVHPWQRHCYKERKNKWIVTMNHENRYKIPALTAEECLELLPGRFEKVSIPKTMTLTEALGTLLLSFFEEKII